MTGEYKYDVSVVIPVYGVEAYIERCARSLFEQTMRSGIEFIFVDDCSKDNSIAVLQQTLSQYPQRVADVKILRQPRNMGVSVARQRGVDAASGEYIIHCDPDDSVVSEIYETLLAEARRTGADITMCDFQNVRNGRIHVNVQEPKPLSALALLGGITGTTFQRLHGSLCNKLIKSTCYRMVAFPPEGLNYCEDVFVLFQICSMKDVKVAYVAGALYSYHIERSDSIVYSVSQTSLNANRQMIELLLDKFQDRSDIMPCVESFAAGLMFRSFRDWQLSPSEFRKQYKQYHKFIKAKKQMKPMQRVVLRVALNFSYRLAKFMWRRYVASLPTLVKIKHKLLAMKQNKPFCGSLSGGGYPPTSRHAERGTRQ